MITFHLDTKIYVTVNKYFIYSIMRMSFIDSNYCVFCFSSDSLRCLSFRSSFLDFRFNFPMFVICNQMYEYCIKIIRKVSKYRRENFDTNVPLERSPLFGHFLPFVSYSLLFVSFSPNGRKFIITS